MKQALQMKLSQKLSMNLQLSQAIQLLQFSAQELREAVEKAYLENPTLEMEYPAEGLASTEHAEETRDFAAWTEYLRGDTSQPRYFTEEQDSHDFAAPAGITLEEELLRQARLVFRQEAELSAACFIIGSLDRNGYLTMRETEIARSLGQSEASVHQVLLRLQQFEPSGVCARDLRECLRIQAEQRGITLHPIAFGLIVEDNFKGMAAVDIVVYVLDGDGADVSKYVDHNGEPYAKMVEFIRSKLNLTSLVFQTVDDLVAAIGLPREKLCTYCWTGRDVSCGGTCAACPHHCAKSADR